MHKVVAPRPNSFPRTYAKIVARVKQAHIVQEFCTTGTELRETYIIQHPSREIDLFPETENSSPRIDPFIILRRRVNHAGLRSLPPLWPVLEGSSVPQTNYAVMCRGPAFCFRNRSN